MRRRLTKTIIAATVCTVLLAGCGTKSDADQAPADTVSEAEESTAGKVILDTQPLKPKTADTVQDKEDADVTADAPADTKKPLIGLATSDGGIDDASFNQSAWEGLQRLSGIYDCDTLFLESNADTDFAGNLDKLIDKDCDLCWGMGYDCAGAILEAAGQNPETGFVIVDFAKEDLPDNVTCITFRSEEASFLAGYVAGNMTQTGKVGFIGGVKDEIIDSFRYGYEAGVKYAATEENKDVEVVSEYAGDYSNLTKGKEIAGKMYTDGCDIIFQAAGATGTGVIEAAKEADKYVIGVDKDQAYMAPGNVLTSVLKYVNEAVVTVSGDYIEEGNTLGRTVSLGLADDAVGLSDNHDLYPEELFTRMQTLRDRIVSGDIAPPSDEEAYKDFINIVDELVSNT